MHTMSQPFAATTGRQPSPAAILTGIYPVFVEISCEDRPEGPVSGFPQAAPALPGAEIGSGAPIF